ncbi:glutathione S-transferase family protein [Neoroseomonas soli]|uniref:Glutathione S-transferase family protein n=1 Tax=Neoroseomonas soli TaxID=1081025 RepID=A0A9X9WUG3_9PROT|nr:glutathione S-transferase N-terminal domain-containing protein [Neoroseomonas soli]MBR0670792.1 glutathione S-transferase family protein [Neoroseomonas soli]
MRRTFYGWATPNSNRVSVMLEECGLDYAVRGVNIRRREQFAPEILALNPYGKVPILVEEAEDGSPPLVLFESGAILLHLAETQGMLLPREPRARAEAMAWLMVALTSLGPYTGQAHHWTELAPEKPEAARAHSLALVDRVYRLLDGRLARVQHLGGDAYGIADIAAFPWVARHGWAARRLEETPNLARWFAEVGARPAVQRGMTKPEGARLE